LPPDPHAVTVVPVSQKPSASQHPVGHVVGSHATPTHAPPAQESPGGHGTQTLPPVPQAVVFVPVSHLPELSQQPLAHVEGLHVTPSHPPDMQESPGGQARHALPPLPHAVVLVPVSHVPEASQHPVGQVVSSHGAVLQVPAVQASPDAHVTHAAPPVPHSLVVEPDSQKPSVSQQPFAQVVASHAGPVQAPPVQVSRDGHGTHAAPPVPQAVSPVPGSHLPALSQQPVAQFVGLQVTPSQPPPEHESPPGQTAHARPKFPHAEVLRPDSQIPMALQHPDGQFVALHAPPSGPSSDASRLGNVSPVRPHPAKKAMSATRASQLASPFLANTAGCARCIGSIARLRSRPRGVSRSRRLSRDPWGPSCMSRM
jgi:hypothetical protein